VSDDEFGVAVIATKSITDFLAIDPIELRPRSLPHPAVRAEKRVGVVDLGLAPSAARHLMGDPVGDLSELSSLVGVH
jgi:hypothetical protein